MAISLLTKISCQLSYVTHQLLPATCKSAQNVQEVKPCKKKLEKTLSDNMIEVVEFQQWTSTDRCSLETLVKNSNDFVEMLIEMLQTLLPHHFIAKEQSKFYRNLKEELEEGMVLCENYTFIAQDAVQSYYWKNDQATLHPFSCYFKLNGATECLSFVVISNYMKHELSAVYAFQKVLIKFLKTKVPNFKKIFFFSDGAAQQYKNKFNVLNVSYHETDFGVQAEWHFFATSHGKGPCDGLAGTLKRNAYLSTLRGVLIRSPEEFYNWAKEAMTGIDVCYIKAEDVLVVKEDLKPRLDHALSVPAMREQHAILPVRQGEVKCKRYSAAAQEQYIPVESCRRVPSSDEVVPGKFVTLVHNTSWILGEVMFCDVDSGDIMVSLLTQVDQPNCFAEPEEPEEDPFQLGDILSLVSPTVSGGIYVLSQDDMTRTSWQLKLKRKECN